MGGPAELQRSSCASMKHKGCKKGKHTWPAKGGSMAGTIDQPWTRVIKMYCTVCGAVQYAKEVSSVYSGWTRIEVSDREIKL